jgi:prepilin-type N-terminal cleavage/methylation domain-containing protein
MQVQAHTDGFSLIELSMVLIIIGLLVGAATTIGQMQIEQNKYIATKQTLENAKLALNTYYAQRKQYPCPANPATAPTVATYGFSVAVDCKTTCPAGLTCPNANVAIGAFPYKTLGLGEEYATDDWGNKILYIIDRNFTPTGNTAVYGAIPLQDSGGNDILQSPIGGDALYVLISAGKNGNGAWPKQGGTRTACIAAQKDGENCNDDAVFIDTTLNDGTNTAATIFDDIIGWKVQESTKHIVYTP